MKKIICLILFSFIVIGASYAIDTDTISNTNIIEIQSRIDRIGFNLLNSNGIEKRTTFNFNIKRTKKATS